MSRTSNKLTQVQIKHAGPGKHFDGGGLYLHVNSDGAKRFRLKYRRPDGREATYTLGPYPQVTLADARRQRDDAVRLRLHGGDPVDARREQRRAGSQRKERSFQQIASDWVNAYRATHAPATSRKAAYVVNELLVPALRDLPIDQLETPAAVDALDRMSHVPSLARKARQYLKGIERLAVRRGLRPPGRPLDLAEALPRRQVRTHLPAATDVASAAEVVRAVRRVQSPTVKAALELLMYTGQRPGNVVSARWVDFDLTAREWHLRAAQMKTAHDHIVPLSAQAFAAVESMKHSDANSEYVFPALAKQRLPHLNENTLGLTLRKLGLDGRHTAHGFRAMMRTLGRERAKIDSEVLEAQLAHAKKGEVQAAYDRTALLEERREAMQRWADYLDSIAAEKTESRLHQSGKEAP